VIAFLLLTFALTWTAWLMPSALGASGGVVFGIGGPVFLVGVFAPAIVALLLTGYCEGRTAVERLLARIGAWRVRVWLYLFAVGYMAGTKLLAAGMYRVVKGTWPMFGETPVVVMLGAILVSTWVQAGEEVGWRGYALPRLANRFGLSWASLLLGVIWASWHLPLFFLPGSGSEGQSFPIYLLHVTALSVAMSWLYWKTGGSLLLVMLMHAAINNTTDIVPSALQGAVSPMSFESSFVAQATAGVSWALAALLLIRMRGAEVGSLGLVLHCGRLAHEVGSRLTQHRLFQLNVFRRFRRRVYDRQPAPEFLFEARRRTQQTSADGGRVVLVAGNQRPHRATRRQQFVLSRAEAPALTITSDPSNSIAVLGTTEPDWTITYSAVGDGESEEEAQKHVQAASMVVTGSTIKLDGRSVLAEPRCRGNLVVEGPMDGSVVIHASYASVEVFELAGSVRVAATHARARVLETTGQVDVTAAVIDFAGSRGRVTLSAEAEVNLKMTATQFDGILTAWAQRSVRLRIPPGFTTPITAVVNHPADFVYRTELASTVSHKRQGELYIFTVGMIDDASAGQVLHLRSEDAAVVIDNVTTHRQERTEL